MGSLPFKNKIMSNQLIVKNSNVEGDSLSLEVQLKQAKVNFYIIKAYHEDIIGTLSMIYDRSMELIPEVLEANTNPSTIQQEWDYNKMAYNGSSTAFRLYYVEKGKSILLNSSDYQRSETIGFIMSDKYNLNIAIKSPTSEGKFVDLNLLTTENNTVYTIPEDATNLYVYVVYTNKYNSINFTHFIKGEEDKLKTKFIATPRGEKLNHIFETINQNNSESISEEVPYSARYEGLFVLNKDTKEVYLYSTEKDLSKIEGIKSDIRFNIIDLGDYEAEYGSYKIIEPLYEDETVTTHPHFNITKVGHPILVFLNKNTKTDNYPFYSANIQSTESLIFELAPSEGEVDITNMDIEFYVGDSFSRAYKIPFNKIGKNTLSPEPLQHSSFRVKSEDLNIYCTIKDGSKIKIYKVNNNIISTFVE